MDKQVYELRGRQSNLSRLVHFDKEAYIHMLFYRALIILSVVAGAVFFASYFFNLSTAVFRAFFMIIWVLFIPQVFESAKGMSVIATRGFVFGHLNKSYRSTAEKYLKPRAAPLFKAFPYAVLAAWLAGLVLLVLTWFI